LLEIQTYNVTVEEILNCIFEIDLNDSLVKEVIKRLNFTYFAFVTKQAPENSNPRRCLSSAECNIYGCLITTQEGKEGKSYKLRNIWVGFGQVLSDCSVLFYGNTYI